MGHFINLSSLMLSFIFFLMAKPVFAEQKAPPEKVVSTKTVATTTSTAQDFYPVKDLNILLVGIHPMKNNPKHQLIAYHYCKQNNPDVMQCMLFDSDTRDAHIFGVEYIISEKYFWHPHNYEILSGQLIAPYVTKAIEKNMLLGKINSYGKTFHFMLKNMGETEVNDDAIPIGKPELAWSINHDNEANQELLFARDKKYNISTHALAEERKTWSASTHPQCGVKALEKHLKADFKSMPGIQNKEACY
jgi:hypothetical protein